MEQANSAVLLGYAQPGSAQTSVPSQYTRGAASPSIRRLGSYAAPGGTSSDPAAASIEIMIPQAVVHILDTDPNVRLLLPRLVHSLGWKTRTYDDLQSFLNTPWSGGVDCLVVDAGLEGGGIESRLPSAIDMPVVMTAIRPDISAAVVAMKAGAVDFLEKPVDERRMLNAVRAAIGAAAQRREAETFRLRLLARYASLTPRERQVMGLVTAGQMNKQVAWELGLSEVTVKAHRGAVMRKMDARSLAELVRMSDMISDGAPGPTGGLRDRIFVPHCAA